MEELKKLIPGESLLTVIQKGVTVEYDKVTSEPQKYLLFYGNVVVDPDTNKRFHADRNFYLEVLENFLQTDEGKRYERPTPEQIDADILACIEPPSMSHVERPAVTPSPESSLEESEATSPEPDEDRENFSSVGQKEDDEYEEEEDSEAENIDGEEEPTDAEEEELEPEPKQKEKKKPFSLFRKKEKPAPAKPEPEPNVTVLTDDKISEFQSGLIEDNNAYVGGDFFSNVSNTASTARISKLTNEVKRLKKTAFALIFAALIPWILMAAGIMNFGPIQTNRSDEIKVISLSKDVKAGDVITKDVLQESIIMRDQFDDLSAGTAVDTHGNTVKNYVQLWSNRNSIIGKYATANLEEGEYLLASDYAVLKNGMNMIELDIDGTKVKVPVTATKAGSSDVRVYAIITSRNEEGVTSSFALNLGELQFNGKSLKDVINAEGNSILEGITLN